MHVVAIIPARYASSRFPGKPLANQTGKYLIQHVYERVLAAKRIDQCIIATDDDRIAEAVAGFGGRVEMTNPDHPSGTDRIAEVVRRLGLSADLAADPIILNVQGDEPEIDPAYLDRLVDRLASENCGCATLACPFSEDHDPTNPNCVKLVTNSRNRALYFSRSLIPYPRDDAGRAAARGAWLLHLGVYAYRRSFLLEFAGWNPSRLERIEKLEQLRILEHGEAIAVETVEHACAGIDTPQDYAEFVRRWNSQPK